MSISFDNLAPVLAAQTEKLCEKAPNQTEVHCWMDQGYRVTVVMKRILIDDGVPKEAQRSGHKICMDIAIVTITPSNEELRDIITKYFLSEKIPSSMGAPERFFFDKVLINEQSFIG